MISGVSALQLLDAITVSTHKSRINWLKAYDTYAPAVIPGQGVRLVYQCWQLQADPSHPYGFIVLHDHTIYYINDPLFRPDTTINHRKQKALQISFTTCTK